ncbi:cold shock domain-containing protein [Algicola sagamiensis]|uniref:cold shock domain-containing protein n=1 Tax=Algicola sagamiensis TaxID=163869 RepID=UPI00037707D6|nr:cold shock domain-containing protein [Algicola sagamiensis]
MSDKMTGKVKFFDTVKGYGFIELDDRNEDIFVHQMDIKMDGYRKLYQGQIVDFDLLESHKGLRAQNVLPVTTGFEHFIK